MTERSLLIPLLVSLVTATATDPAAARMPWSEALAAARIDPATVSIQAVTPAEAHALKSSAGSRALLIDIRGWDEIHASGTPAGIDAVLPFPVTGQAPQDADGRRVPDAVRAAQFVAAVRAQVEARHGDLDTPLLLLCRSGAWARTASRVLTLAGFGAVRPISGGFDGELAPDGQRRGGWKETLPWQRIAAEAQASRASR